MYVHVDCFNAKEFLEYVKKQFKSSNKALSGTLMNTLTIKKIWYDDWCWQHILEMTSLAKWLKSIDMIIFEPLLVQFVLNPLPYQFVPF